MAILLDEKSRVILQGITGKAGSYHAGEMRRQGTSLVAGVSPGKGGQKVEEIPVYDTVREAVRNHGADISLIMVPAAGVYDAVLEAVDAEVPLVVPVAEGVPVHDTLHFVALAMHRGVRVVGPNTPGIISPGKAKLGIMPTVAFSPGVVGIVSRSGTLSYEIAINMTRQGLGQSTFVGIGGDLAVGTDFADVLELFERDSYTRVVVLVGEQGGAREEAAAQFIQERMTKPVVAFISGRQARPGRRMGHAGAIVMRGIGTIDGKIRALREAGAYVAETPSQIPSMIRSFLDGDSGCT